MTSTFAERLARCDREIGLAMAESHKPHTGAEHAGILLWEMDWRIERENVLAEMGALEKASPWNTISRPAAGSDANSHATCSGTPLS